MLVEAADDHLFNRPNISCNKEHVLNSVLPSSIQLIYELRPKFKLLQLQMPTPAE